MSLVDILTLACAVVAVLACWCRLDGLRFGHHQIAVIVMHGALCSGCAAAGMNAWHGQAGLLEVATVIGTLAWLRTSFPSWQSGPPRNVQTRPTPLDTRP